MPTPQPRYTVTDTGEVRDMLDLAQRRWPQVDDRRQLLLRLAGIGADRIASELDGAVFRQQRERQLDALRRAPKLLDVEVLLSGAAWRSATEA